MNNEIEKSESPTPDDVLAAIQSFNDPSIIVNIFQEMGWNYSLEIKETLAMVKQNANLSIKFKALKHLRELLREAAETAGYTANISSTIPNAQGGQTTFSAKRIAGILNPVKQIESTVIKESQNDQTKEIESHRECDRPESQNLKGLQKGSLSESNTLDQNTRRADPSRDAVSGGPKPPDGGETPEQPSRSDTGNEESGSPCIETRPPTCDPKLFPGISISAEEE